MKSRNALLIGSALAGVTLLLLSALPSQHGIALLAVILAAAAAVYAGSALAEAQKGVLQLETSVFIIVASTAVLGLWYSPLFLAVGYIGHGVWDALHHPHRIGAPAGAWFPPFCMVYDLIVGAFILVKYV